MVKINFRKGFSCDNLRFLYGSVSEATLNTSEVISAIENFLQGILTPESYASVVASYNKLAVEDYCWEHLFDVMNMIAPEGYSFRSHEGNGSDFSFWKDDDEDTYDEERGFSYIAMARRD